MSNAWLMLEYMSESAKLAVINKDKSYIEQGLYANVIEGCKQDYRDNLIRLTKLYHSPIILELNPDKIFKSVANQTRGEGKELILKFIKRAPCNKTLKCMGLKTTRGEQFDFISFDFNDVYFKLKEYSEPTDKKLMSTRSSVIHIFRFCLDKLFGTWN